MIYSFEIYELDTQLFELRRSGQAVRLERQVFDLLAYLVENRDRLVPKDELLEQVWGDRFVGEAALSSRVMAARKAIGDNGREQRLIRTVHGRGYRFAGEVRQESSQPLEALPTVTAHRGVQGETRDATSPARSEQQIRFCTAPDGVRLAYAVVGEGPPLVKAPNWLSHLEFEWRSPVWRHWIEELSRDHTLVRYDQRGCGLSDWDVDDLSWEAWVRDLETVVDALGIERFPLLGVSQGGSVAIAYAVAHPERVSHLILYGAFAQGWMKRSWSPERIEEEEAVLTLMRTGWGRDNPAYRQLFASSFIPGASWEQMRWFNDLCRISASPENAVRFRTASAVIDVTALLARVQVPTLVLHARGDLRQSFEQGRLLAAGIPGARFEPLDSSNHILLEDEPAWGRFLQEVHGFLGVSSTRTAQLGSTKTILFTDVEGSTHLTEELGDGPAREVLRAHEVVVREALGIHGGTEIKTMGDGFMVSFRSATRAIECAIAIQKAEEQRSDQARLKVRIGLNAGEPVTEGDDLFGSSVNMAARIAAEAQGGEILISDVVRQLVAGKGFRIEERDPTPIRGFAEPVTICEVLWRQ